MLLIKNGCLVFPEKGTQEKLDILISEGRIVRMAAQTTMEEYIRGDHLEPEIIDAGGMTVSPGLVDVHVHFRDPGFTYKEDILSGALAAARGGFTTVVLMANTKPPADQPEVIDYILKKGKQTGIHVETCGNITVGMKGEALTNMEALAAAGAVGFTDDGVALLDSDMVLAAMKEAARLARPVSFHEEDPAFIENNGVNAGAASKHFAIAGSDRNAEIAMVKRDLELAKEPGADIVIQHISTKEAVDLVREAKKTNPHIHAEAAPHHFTLTQEAVIRQGTLAKMNPPLREEADRLAVIQGLKDGSIDIIATDHAPHSEEEKSLSITEAPSGIIGLETSLSLGIRELVMKNHLSLPELICRMSYTPAKLYGLEAGFLQEKGPADLVIFQQEESWRPKHFVSKSSNSPFIGELLPGIVHYTICGGKIVYSKNE